MTGLTSASGVGTMVVERDDVVAPATSTTTESGLGIMALNSPKEAS